MLAIVVAGWWWFAAIDLREGCSWVSPSLVLLGVGMWIAGDVGRWVRGA